MSPINQRKSMVELTKLSRNKDVVVCKPDKGRGVVLLDGSRYVQPMHKITGDSIKFVPISEYARKLSVRIEDKTNNFLRELKSSGYIAGYLYRSLHVTGSAPGILYGLPKSTRSVFADFSDFKQTNKQTPLFGFIFITQYIST